MNSGFHESSNVTQSLAKLTEYSLQPLALFSNDESKYGSKELTTFHKMLADFSCLPDWENF